MFGRAEDSTINSSVIHGASSQQGSSQSLYIPLAVAQGEDAAHSEHGTIKVDTTTKASNPKEYIKKTYNWYSCDFPGCSHQGRFDTTKRVISHIRAFHTQESSKSYKCTW